jgi:hypothetical protein
MLAETQTTQDTQNTQDTQAVPAEAAPAEAAPAEPAPAEPQTDPRRRYLCRHIFADGHRCGSPALRYQNFCFYHHAGRRPAHAPGKFRYLDATEPFTLPLVEDRASALLAASLVLSRIASNDLDHARSGRLIADLRVIARLLPREPRLTTAGAPHLASEMWVPQNASSQPLVEDLILDEAHGLIAPITELPEPNPADPLQNCHPERSSDPLQNCHPERSSASAPNAVEGPAVASPTAATLQSCHPERSSASAPNAVEGPAVASHTAATPRPSPRAPKRVYTDEEKDFLKCTISSTHYAPVHRPRPESITDDDIIAAINALRRRCSLGPIDTDPNWNKATLSSDPVHPPEPAGAVTPNNAATPNNAVILSAANGVPGQLAGWGEKNPRIQPEAPQLCADTSTLAPRYPEASASGLSSAAQEEGALAPGVSNSRTLPTVQAVAAPTYHLPLTTRLSPPAGWCKAHRPRRKTHPSNPPRTYVVLQTHFG